MGENRKHRDWVMSHHISQGIQRNVRHWDMKKAFRNIRAMVYGTYEIPSNNSRAENRLDMAVSDGIQHDNRDTEIGLI